MKIAATKTKVVSYDWRSKDSPVWGLLKLVISAGVMTGLLYAFASSFNSTEVKAIVGMFIAHVLLEGINVRSKTSQAFKDALTSQDE